MKRLILFILMFAYIMPSFAQSKGDGAPYRGDWGASNIDLSSSNACDVQGTTMGLTQLVHKELKNKGILAGIMQKNYLGYVGQEYVAREINKYGAKFCKTIIAGDRTNCYHSPYTTYFEPEVQDCFWLCKVGYYGTECKSTSLTSVTPQIPLEQYLNKKTTSKLAPFGTSGDNIEDEIPMFIANQYINCWDKYSGKTKDEDRYSRLITDDKQEHDVILVLSDISPDETNPARFAMFVRPVIVRAGGSEKCSGNEAAWTAWPMMKGAGELTVVCPSDYKQEAANGTIFCVDPGALEKQEKDNLVNLQQDKQAHMCNGYLASLFDDTKHDLLVVDKTTLNILPRADQPEPGNTTYNWESKKACTMYRCKNPSLAFKAGWSASGDASCYECSGDPMRYGVNDLGECQQCAKGEIFDSNTKKCEKARVFSKNDMRFGVGNAPSADLEEQCWTKDNPTDYKNCMLGVTIVEGSISQVITEEEITKFNKGSISQVKEEITKFNSNKKL